MLSSNDEYRKPYCYYDVQTTPPVTDKCKYPACNKENMSDYEKERCKELCESEDVVEYKNVNKSDIFPYKATDKVPEEGDQKTNWDTEWGRKVQDHLEKTNVETTRYSDDLLDYSITLTPEQIKSIRKYNKKNSYKNSVILPHTCTIAGEEGYEKYYNCESQYMQYWRMGEREFGTGTYGKLRVDYNGNKCQFNGKDYSIDSATHTINDRDCS